MGPVLFLPVSKGIGISCFSRGPRRAQGIGRSEMTHLWDPVIPINERIHNIKDMDSGSTWDMGASPLICEWTGTYIKKHTWFHICEQTGADLPEETGLSSSTLMPLQRERNLTVVLPHH